MHESYLIQDLTTIIVIAGAVSVVFSILRWPSILGYLLSGLIVGPYVTEKFSIHDASSVKSISELGVIFLMFCIGLEFDLKKLKQTLFPSLLAMLFQALTAFFIGTTVAHVIGWSPVLGIFLGKRFQHRSFIPGLSFRGFRFFCLDLCCIRIHSRGRLRSTGSGCVSGRSRGRAAGKDHGSRQ